MDPHGRQPYETDRFGRTPRRAALAWCLLALSVAQVITGVVGLLLAGVGMGEALRYDMIADLAIAIAYPSCGALIALHRPRNPAGWLLIAYGLGHAFTGLSIGLAALGLEDGWPTVLLRALTTVGRYTWVTGSSTAFVLAVFLFPDGRLTGPRWRYVVIVQLLTAPMDILVWSSWDWGLFHGTRAQPLVPDTPSWLLTAEIGKCCAALVAALTSLTVRYRRGGEKERRQLLWLILGILPEVVNLGMLGAGVRLPQFDYVVLFLPAAIAIAVLRHELLDIRLVVSRALLFALLTGMVIAAYVGLVAVFDVLMHRQPGLIGSSFATLAVAFAFNPARRRLQAVVERALYGERTDPVRAVSRIGERLAGAGVCDVPEAVCEALRLPYAAVGESRWGTRTERTHTLSLGYEGRGVGELVVGLRPGERELAPADLAVLELLAVPLAAALHATVLSAQLQQSRERIVAAREEERRRIRRDLHDGLGPTLAGAAFQADAAHNLLTVAPQRTGELLTELRAEIGGAVQEIRRLVDGLRPPDLDQLGLIGALRERSERLAWRADGVPVDVRVDAPALLPVLPAAVEVAAYRIATEALTNAARHSGASRVELRIVVGEGLRVEVSDDGTTESSWRPGVGITSMQERAAELGGSCVAGRGRVVAMLPLGEPV
ncbi:histidine kinase [Streptomyces sp. NPDC050738]|uniref:sensor histidine kinase n=1 Tax=Streptomyces sp. NPDC050738 TaxID=3154744 RepID=UPI0034371F35